MNESRSFSLAHRTCRWLAYCRSGFEAEASDELIAHAASHSLAAFSRVTTGAAFALIDSADGNPLGRPPAWRSVIFSRQVLSTIAVLEAMNPKDRLTPVIDALSDADLTIDALWVETPDSPDGEQLRALARGLENAARPLLRKQGRLAPDAPQRAHLCLLTGTQAVLGFSVIDDAAPWPGGIPRLKFPREAPSRSTLKLEEAFLVLLDDAERQRGLRPGMTAVDLGASPGGWTWQLVRRSIRTTAVDNGPMDERLLASGLVDHQRTDGFRFRPRKPVDWVVCDMVEQPSRVTRLMAEWLTQGHARAAVFNLKLPMKKRWLETQRCLDELRSTLGSQWQVRAKQLYHDREEVTVAAIPSSLATRR
jgi:23S rRNA (cytidine2498-2'-O)-methyltransferase